MDTHARTRMETLMQHRPSATLNPMGLVPMAAHVLAERLANAARFRDPCRIFYSDEPHYVSTAPVDKHARNFYNYTTVMRNL